MKHSASSKPETSSHLFCVRPISRAVSVLCCGLLGLAMFGAFADELRTTSGERLVGKTVSVGERTVEFWSTSAGKVILPRTNVASINIGVLGGIESAGKTNQLTAAETVSSTNSGISAALRSLPSQPGVKKEVDSLLEQAGPEATAKFNQMVKGLLSGSMSLADLRAQAATVRDQARAFRSEVDDETGEVLDSYLAVLDRFLAQTPALQAAKTNSIGQARR